MAWAEEALRWAIRSMNDAIDTAHAAGIAPAAAASMVTSAATLGILGSRYLGREIRGWDDIYEAGPRPGGPGDIDLLDLHARPRPGASQLGPGSGLRAPRQLARTGAGLAEAEIAFADAIARFDDAADLAQCAAVPQGEVQGQVTAHGQALGPIGRAYVGEEISSWTISPPHDLADQLADGAEPAAFWEAAWQARAAKGCGDYGTAALAWEQARDQLHAGHPLRTGLDGMIASLRTADRTGQHVTWDGRLMAANSAGVTPAPAIGDAPPTVSLGTRDLQLPSWTIRTPGGDRAWQAESMDHALEQHNDAFPDETVYGVWLNDGTARGEDAELAGHPVLGAMAEAASLVSDADALLSPTHEFDEPQLEENDWPQDLTGPETTAALGKLAEITLSASGCLLGVSSTHAVPDEAKPGVEEISNQLLEAGRKLRAIAGRTGQDESAGPGLSAGPDFPSAPAARPAGNHSPRTAGSGIPSRAGQPRPGRPR
jgi:hypothetical protein